MSGGQPIVLVALAYALGIFVADACDVVTPRSVLALAALCWCAALWRSGWSRLACALLCSASLGAASLSARLLAAEAERPKAGFEVTLAARLCGIELQRQVPTVDLCDAREVGGARSLPARIRLQLPSEGARPAWALRRVGDPLRARLRVRPVRGLRNPGGRDRRRELAREGIGAVARLVHPHWWVPIGPASGLGVWPWSGLRTQAGAGLREAGPGAGLVAALALGDRSGLSDETRAAFRALGLSHLLAVSGLHIVLVAGIGFALVRRFLKLSKQLADRGAVVPIALGVTLLVAFAYGGMTGFGVPVCRALVFLGVLVVGELLGRRSGPASLLALAALLLLLWNPAWLFSLGAQLSFLATAGLMGAREVAADRGLAGWLSRSLATTSAALLSTLPLLASVGAGGSAVGLVANLVAVPCVALVLLPGSLLALAGVLVAGSEATGNGLPAGLDMVLLLAHWTELACTASARSLGELWPGVGSLSRVPPIPWVAFCALLGLAALRLGWIGRVIMVLVLSGLLSIEFAGGAQGPRIVALDVGQGDALVLQTPRAAVLVDAGWAAPEGADLGRSIVIPALRALGVRALDLAVVTHADLDHRGGMSAVLRAVPVGELWLPLGASREPAFADLRALAAAQGTRVREVAAGRGGRAIGDLDLEVLWPAPGLDGAVWTRNERSIVLRVGIAGRRLLLTADVGEPAESRLLRVREALQADILKIGHHGSRESSSPGFLRAVGADLALVSAPCCGSRLPSSEALTRARDAGASLWWTGRDGAVVVELGPPLAVWGFATDWGFTTDSGTATDSGIRAGEARR